MEKGLSSFLYLVNTSIELTMCKVLPQEFTDINPLNTSCPHNDPVPGTPYKIQDSEMAMSFLGLLPEALHWTCTGPAAWQPGRCSTGW